MKTGAGVPSDPATTAGTLLWQKSGTAIDDRVQRFLTGEDVRLDKHLLPYDIESTAAHVRGLARIGVITAAQAAGLESALADLAAAVLDGSFVLDERYEDGHSAIESELTTRLGDAGRHGPPRSQPQ